MYPAGEPGLRVTRLNVEGLSLRAVLAGPESGPAMILVHGWGACVYSFSEMIPALASAGRRVVAIDLPGFGLSDKPADERRYTTRALADVTLAAARALGVERYWVAGHSMGGAIALDIACRKPPGLIGIVLLNAVGIGAAPVMTPLKIISPRFVDRITPMVLTRGLVRLTLAVSFGTRGRPTERDVDEYWAPMQFPEYARACRACVHQGTWRRVPDDELRALSIPVLVVAGGRDPMVLGSHERARLIPHAHVAVVPDGGHLALQECADRVNQEVLRFLAGHAA